jgi:hypothetical protein
MAQRSRSAIDRNAVSRSSRVDRRIFAPSETFTLFELSAASAWNSNEYCAGAF